MSVRFLLLLIGTTLISACSSNSTPISPSPTVSSVSIVSGASTLTTTAFSPNPLTVPVGTTVTWINNDNTTHDATSNTGAFDTGMIAPGVQVSHQFSTAGTFAYHCSIHPNMIATIIAQ